MERRFVQHMQEREAARVGRGQVMAQSTTAAQRSDYAAQYDALVQETERRLDAGDAAAAQGVLQQLRVLVQDTANSVTLTAHDMARANSTLTRLQQRIAAAEGRGGVGGAAVRRFRFSARPTATTEASTASSRGSSSGVDGAASTDVVAAPTGEVAPTTPPTQQQQQQQQQQHVYGGAEDATVYVDTAPAVFIRACHRCTVLCLPIAGSVFVDDCRSCTLYVACHQLRMRNCRDVHVYVWCASTPVIEHCDDMYFASYDKWGGLLRSTTADGRSFASHVAWVSAVGDMDAAGARVRESYRTVNDFQWLTKTPSPHWRVLRDAEARTCEAVFVHTTDAPRHTDVERC